MSVSLPGPDPFYHTRSVLCRLHAALVSAKNIANADVETAPGRDTSTVLDALKDSEQRYRRLFETAQDGILILSNDHGGITDANPFITTMLGYSRDELIGKELWEIGLLKDKPASQEAFRQLEANSFIRYEDLPLQSQRGESRAVEFVSNLYSQGGGDRHPVQHP